MKHIEEIQIAGHCSATVRCDVCSVCRCSQRGKYLEAVTNLQKLRKLLPRLRHRQKPPLKMPALPFILRKAIMITITMMTLVMTAPTMTLLMMIHPMTTPLPVRFSRMIRIPTQEIREALTVTLLLMLIPEIRTPLMFPMIQG